LAIRPCSQRRYPAGCSSSSPTKTILSWILSMEREPPPLLPGRTAGVSSGSISHRNTAAKHWTASPGQEFLLAYDVSRIYFLLVMNTSPEDESAVPLPGKIPGFVLKNQPPKRTGERGEGQKGGFWGRVRPAQIPDIPEDQQ
jgi:hypothetical protein